VNYIFYAFADSRFLALIIGVSTLNYILAILIGREKYKGLWLWTGVLINLGALGYFKYFDFFVTSFNSLFKSAGLYWHLQTLDILLPVGISYFTFRVLSYLLDVDKGKVKAEKDVIAFFNYVTFFPCIFSGPIDRARDFLPQLKTQRKFEYDHVVDGFRQFLWGLFKKLVIADNCAVLVNLVFDNYQHMQGSSLLVGAVFYAIQLYADFSGYSDMAIGVGRTMGFNVTKNFNFPFFAQNIADFWRRWHISLTSWLTEYVFTPMSIALRDYGKLGLSLAITTNFVLVGLWHGAAWTFVVFGLIHGCLFIPLVLAGTMNKQKPLAKDKWLPSVREAFNMVSTFAMVTLTVVLIRAENLGQAYSFWSGMFSSSLFSWPIIAVPDKERLLVLVSFFMMLEWFGRDGEYAIEKTGQRWPRWIRWSFYYFVIYLTLLCMSVEGSAFIYFQF